MRRLLCVGALGLVLTTGVRGSPDGPMTQSPQSQPPAAPAPPTEAPAPQGPAQQASAQTPQQPTFRVGATLVRVDAFVTKNGVPVSDLTADDFKVLEDNVPQTIRTFEYVNIPPGRVQAGERRDPQTVAQSREAAGDPRRRVFVLFLDTYHVTQGAGMSSRAALQKFLQEVIGPDDLIAGMTPEMAPEALTFATRTAALETVLNSVYGKRDSIHDTQEENQMSPCFSREEWPVYKERRRAKMTLDALEGLIYHVEGLREERKAVITVTEGWPLFREDLQLSRDPKAKTPPRGPDIVVGPGGKLGTSGMENPYGLTRGTCEAYRLQMASIETYQQFRDLPNLANRANASFYTVDPRGLAVFDAPIGPTAPPPVNVDHAILRNKLERLRELAERTDGLAVQNTNDLSGALTRIARDLSAYYLIGYDSTNTKMDGSYREIKVQLTRPGLQVRARRGYQAPVDGRRTSAGPGASPTASARGGAGGGGAGSGTGAARAGVSADVAAAVSALSATRGDLPIRLRVATLRLAPPAAAGAPSGAASSAPSNAPSGAPAASVALAGDAAPAGAETTGEMRELRIFAEIDAKVAANSVWQQGGTARVVLRGLDGTSLATSEATLGVGERTMAITVPLPPTIAPGEYRVQVRVTNASKIDSVGDSVAITVPAKATTIGEAAVLRRGPSTGVKYLPTADLRFRRQERVRLEAPLVIPLSRVHATVVDQAGNAMSLPVQVTERTDGAARLLVVDVSLAPLAAGGYAIVVTDTDAASGARVLVPLQLVP